MIEGSDRSNLDGAAQKYTELSHTAVSFLYCILRTIQPQMLNKSITYVMESTFYYF